MNKKYSYITDISYINSNIENRDNFIKLFNNGLFNNKSMWNSFKSICDEDELRKNIKARMKYYMSSLSLGVYNALEKGPEKNIINKDEIYLFSGFTEIGTVSKIGDLIMTDDYSINPSLFPNSVHHISLCYYTILKKLTNYCTAITDGPQTNLSFINFIKNRVKVNENFIIVTGEEDASFFDYDTEERLEITPSFTAYKIKPQTTEGFYYHGVFNNLDEVMSNKIFKSAENIFTDKATFLSLKSKKIKNLFTDYPISRENPCGIIYRLAMPFYLKLKGISVIIDKANDKFYLFEVLINN